MKRNSQYFLWMGLGFSLALHSFLFQSTVFIALMPEKPIAKPSTLIMMNIVAHKPEVPEKPAVQEKKIEAPKPAFQPEPIPKPEPAPKPKSQPKPVPKPKPAPQPEPIPKPKPALELAPKPEQQPKADSSEIKEITELVQTAHKSALPPSHKRQADAEQQAGVNPVFGVTGISVSKAGGSGFAVRVGNTLMKEQEAGITPAEEVQDYITVPAFDVSSLPVFISRIRPEYPEALKTQELEGEVLISATIDAKGQVAAVTVIRSDHPLFTEAAVSAIKRSRFKPATLNGQPVATILDDITYSFVINQS